MKEPDRDQKTVIKGLENTSWEEEVESVWFVYSRKGKVKGNG